MIELAANNDRIEEILLDHQQRYGNEEFAISVAITSMLLWQSRSLHITPEHAGGNVWLTQSGG
ncbi:MAG: hypothetical protein EOM03_02340 [Clostridia bacterium]|nr:hypothetical protein [Clostridia bacterium]NLF20743.1 hypothetical protein [Clostridiaceae bacterium]